MSKVAKPSELDTWFHMAHGSEPTQNPTLPYNSVTVILNSTGQMVYYPRAEDVDWNDVFVYQFGDST